MQSQPVPIVNKQTLIEFFLSSNRTLYFYFQIVKDQNEAFASLKYTHKASALNRRELVETNGIEPMTSCLQSRRSPN